MKKLNIEIDIKTLRKKLRFDYKYDEMVKFTGIPRTVIYRFLNDDTKSKDLFVFIKLCTLAGIDWTELVTVNEDEGEN